MVPGPEADDEPPESVVDAEPVVVGVLVVVGPREVIVVCEVIEVRVVLLAVPGTH